MHRQRDWVYVKKQTKNKIAVGGHSQLGTWEAACMSPPFLLVAGSDPQYVSRSQSGTCAQVDLKRICYLTDSNMLLRSRDR